MLANPIFRKYLNNHPSIKVYRKTVQREQNGNGEDFIRQSKDHRTEVGTETRKGKGNKRNPVHEGNQQQARRDLLGGVREAPQREEARGLRVRRLDEDHEGLIGPDPIAQSRALRGPKTIIAVNRANNVI